MLIVVVTNLHSLFMFIADMCSSGGVHLRTGQVEHEVTDFD